MAKAAELDFWVIGVRAKGFFLGQLKEYYTSLEKSKNMVMDIQDVYHQKVMESDACHARFLFDSFEFTLY